MTIRSMSPGTRPAFLIAAAAAATARLDVVSPSSAMRRSLMPVRSVIHSSDVSMRCSRSALVRVPSGRAVPHPVIAALIVLRTSGDAEPGHGLTLTQALTAVHEHADESAGERAAHGRRCAGAVEVADRLARAHLCAVLEVVERAEHADGRRDA